MSPKGKIACSPRALHRRRPLPYFCREALGADTSRQRRAGAGRRRGAAPHTILLSPLPSCPSPAPDPENKAPVVSSPRRTVRVYAGRCFSLLETPSGASFFKSFSLSAWRVLSNMGIIHSASHSNKKAKVGVFWREGEHHETLGVWCEACGAARLCSRPAPSVTLFLLQHNGSSEASAETRNRHAGKSAGCVRAGLDKIHPKHSPHHNTTKNSGALKSEK